MILSVVKYIYLLEQYENNKFKQQAPTRTYIPSPEPAKITGPDMTAANQALAEADMTEKFINETLASMR